jgi:low temperature requirement protein LtrA
VGLLLLAVWLVWQPRSRLTLDRLSSERDVIRESP